MTLHAACGKLRGACGAYDVERGQVDQPLPEEERNHSGREVADDDRLVLGCLKRAVHVKRHQLLQDCSDSSSGTGSSRRSSAGSSKCSSEFDGK